MAISNASGSVLDSAMMMNDGLHHDGLPGDSIWGVHFRAPSAEAFYSLDQTIRNHTVGSVYRLPAQMFFTTAGPIVCSGDTHAIAPQWGKLLNFKFKFRNNGNSIGVSAIQGIIRSLDTCARITAGGLMSVGDLAPGQERLSSAVTIACSSFVKGSRTVPFTISLTSGSVEYWRETIGILVVDPTGVAALNETIPLKYWLDYNYPNPFNPTTTIRFSIPRSAITKLSIIDLLGREVAVLVNEKKEAGRYSLRWDASKMASGVYFYALSAGEFRETKKMTLMK